MQIPNIVWSLRMRSLAIIQQHVNSHYWLKVEVSPDRIELLRNQLKDEGVVEVLNKYCEDQGDAISYDFND